MSYSVVIRTLALNQSTLRLTLESVFGQTVPPREVKIYLAEGFDAPSWRVGSEQYVSVPKGMMSQRVRPYDDLIPTEALLMLDDDVAFGPTLVSRLLAALREGYDLVGADVMKTHLLPPSTRLQAALTGFVLPSRSRAKAFRLRPSGAFSYITRPEEGIVYPADTIAGPVMMWRHSAWRHLDLTAELWLERFGFAYGDDALLSYKAVANGYRVGCLFTSDVENLDAATSSARYERDPERFYVRTLATLLTWHRMLYRPRPGRRSLRALAGMTLRQALLLPVMTAASLASRSLRPLASHLRALRDFPRLLSRPPFSILPPYILDQR